MNISRARYMGELSQLIYDEDFLVPHYDRTLFLDVDGCQALCLNTRHEYIFVFRGTDEWEDVTTNIKIQMSQDPYVGDAYVHHGFKEELDSIWDLICGFIRDKQQARITTTGHSLGGALALLCASRFSYLWNRRVECFTFGVPEIGGFTFETLFQTLPCIHWRIRHNNDKVSEIHLLDIVGYKHVGTLVHIMHNKQFVIGDLTWRQRLWDWFAGHWSALLEFRVGDSLNDHAISGYVEALRLEELRIQSNNNTQE